MSIAFSSNAFVRILTWPVSMRYVVDSMSTMSPSMSANIKTVTAVAMAMVAAERMLRLLFLPTFLNATASMFIRASGSR